MNSVHSTALVIIVDQLPNAIVDEVDDKPNVAVRRPSYASDKVNAAISSAGQTEFACFMLCIF